MRFLPLLLILAWLLPADHARAQTKELSPDEQIAAGQTYYAANCLKCHNASGTGVPAQYPPLANSSYVNDPSEKPKQLIAIVLYGLIGPFTVNGQKFNNEMAPFGKQLSDEKIAAILTYVRQEWGNNAPPVTAAAVAAIRAELAKSGRSEQWTEKELQALTNAP
jgi:mono/diheme cytochrome c family protein